MTDLAKLGLALEATPMLSGLQAVDKALDATAARAEKLVATIKTATGQMAAAFSKVKDSGTEKQAATIEKMNYAIEHQAKAYRALLEVMRQDSAIAKSAAAQRILLNSAFASGTAEINASTIAGAKNLAGLRSETAATTSLAVAQGGLTATEKQLLDAKTRRNLVVKAYTDSVRSEIAAQTKQVALSDAHVAAYRREAEAINAVTAALKAERAAQQVLGSQIMALQRRQNAQLGLSAAPKDLFVPYAQDPKVKAAEAAARSILTVETEVSHKRIALADAHVKAYQREVVAIEKVRAAAAMELRMRPILSTGSVGLPTRATSAFNNAEAQLYTPTGIGMIDKRRESLAQLAVTEQQLHAQRASGAISAQEYAYGMKEITKQTNLAVAGNTRARGVFRQTASALASATFEITGAAYGIGAALASISAPAAFGFKLLSTLEQTKLGMAAILVSMGEINGEAVKLPVALQVAAGMTQRVQENALKYGVSIRALADTTRSIMAPGLGAGLQLKEIEKIALAGSIAVKTIGLDSRQSVQEIRDLVAGGIQAASSTLARSLGINDKMVKEWTKAGTLYENLMTRLAGFQDTAILNTETLSGAWEIFAQKIQLAFANSEAFDMFKQKLIDISNWIGKVDVNSGKFKFNEDVVNSVTSYYESFKVTLDVLSEVGKVLALLKPVIQTIASLIVNAIYVVRMFAGEVKTMATQLVALAHLDFKNFKLIGSDWEKESKAARVEVDRLTRSILGLKEAQAGSSKLLGKWGIGAASPWSKVDPALFIRGKNTATGEDPTGKGRAKADPIKAFIDALKKEAETMGMGEIALKRYEAAKLGLKGKTKELADALINQIDKQRDALAAAKESNAASEEAMKAEDERIKAMEDLIAAQGVETSKLQFEASLIGKSNEERYISIGLHEAEVKGLQLSGAALDQYTTMLEKQYNLQKRISDEGKLTSLLSNTDVVKTKELYENVRLLDDAYFKLGSTMSDAQYAQAMKDLLGSTKDAVKELDTFAENAAKNIQDSMAEFLFNPFDKGLKGMAQGFGTMIQKMIAEAVAADLARKLFGGLTDKGKTSGSGLFGDILGAFGSFMGLANGGAFGPGGNVQAFASGGIMGPTGGMLNQPTIFPMGNGGIGIGGEAGVEAVMPLKRGPDGKLGVSAGNGGSTNITVIVQGGQSAPDVRRAAGQGAREALGLLNGARRYG